MKPQKMSLANIQGRLSRAEMRNIMGGSDECLSCSRTTCSSDSDCIKPSGNCICGGVGKCTLKTGSC
jgi:hypothetical protein